MKTNEEINEMVKQMVVAVCHGGFGRLQAMLGAKADKITDNSFQFTFKMFRKANIFKIELDEAQDLYNCYFIKQRKFTTKDFIKGLSFEDAKFQPVTVKEVKAAKVAAIKKGLDPDIAGNSSALIRHLVSEFLRSAK